MPDIHLLAISGSLRSTSRNTSALRWIAQNVPAGTSVEIADIGDFPLYNWDLEQEQGIPEGVRRVADEIEAADGVLIASPEYNFSITGPLKNALDWLSRPPKPLRRKPVAAFGVAGRSGSLRSQLHLRDILLHDEAEMVIRPEVLITISDAFDGSEFVGVRAQEQLLRLVDALRAHILHRETSRHRVLVVDPDARMVGDAVRLLLEVAVDGVPALTDDDAVAQIDAGGFAAVLLGSGLSDESRAMLKELALASPDDLPCVDVDNPRLIARVAVQAIHD